MRFDRCPTCSSQSIDTSQPIYGCRECLYLFCARCATKTTTEAVEYVRCPVCNAAEKSIIVLGQVQ